MTATYGDTALKALSPEAYKVPTPYGWYAQASWVNGAPLPGTKPEDAEVAESNESAIHIAVYPHETLGVNAFSESLTDVKQYGIAVFHFGSSSDSEPTYPESYLLDGEESKVPGLVQINDLDVIVEADKLDEALRYIKTSLAIIDTDSLNENSKGLLSFGEVIASYDLFKDLAGRGKCLNIEHFRDDQAHSKPLRLVKVVDQEDGYLIYLLATVSVDTMRLETHFQLHKDTDENEREAARLILSRLDFPAISFLSLDPMDYIMQRDGDDNAYSMLVRKALES